MHCARPEMSLLGSEGHLEQFMLWRLILALLIALLCGTINWHSKRSPG